ncbi:putative long-chain-fatty-acid CoA ligase [Desulfosarcina ovata subsp. sediminis]|uniref:Putative long-chain-fatty-acid CoA ligase n=1 Tax=Desulfosarcina ovata subsp. sediminis TaxID=885957 RepID=A0A5K7ZM22_9BACT|nr:long-chain-fatty-acid--CoA ligase [Desulfosarcina ovata]BBO82031.1 putative long-chain-fatty-acid CoA ligase [Desulfosarcina ovata subsp. sediminis]
MLIRDMLRMTTSRVPNKEALVMEETSLTYEQLNSRVNRLAHGMLGMSLRKGDRVAVLTHNNIEYYETYLALCKIGGVMVPFNNLQREKEFYRDFEYIKPRFIFFESEFASMVEKLMARISSLEKAICIGPAAASDHLPYESLMEGQNDQEPDVEVKPDDLMSIFLTSGTTGNPKGVMRTQHHNALNAMVGAIELGLRPDDRVLLTFPFYHVTLEDRFCHILRGNTIVIRKEGSFRAPDVLDLISRHRISVCQFVPTMLNTLLQDETIDQYDLSALRLILYAAAPMPVALLKKAMARFPTSGFMQFFGQTETGPLTITLRPEDHRMETEQDLQRLASCGRPAVHFDVRIVDEMDQEIPRGEVGELTVRGEAMTIGYWELPEESEKLLTGGWLHTGDFARQDEDGFIYIVDRKNDMIISGGKNIYPREVEEVLYSHPAVLEATIIGVPDPHWGESVKAIVVLKPGISTTAEELISFCKENMASYKKPSTIEFRDILPKSPAGKILKRVLRDEFWKEQDRKV